MEFDWNAALERVQQFDGTRHMHRRAIPGVGVDCVNLVVEGLRAAGAMQPDQAIPRYRRTAGFGKTHNDIEDAVLAAVPGAHVTRDPATHDFRDGDIAIFTINRSCNHVGIVLGGEIWHSQWAGGVLHEAPDTCAHALQSVVRIETT